MDRLTSLSKHIQPPKMPYKMNPEVEVALRPRMEAKAKMGPIATHDVETRRKLYGAVFGLLNEQTPNPGDVSQKVYHTKTPDGHSLEMTWFTKNGTQATPGPAILHIHGGGMILASVPQYNFALHTLVSATSVPFLSVEYRYAPEYPAPTLVEDCFVALKWLRDNASTLLVDPTRIGIYGDSGGGGIAAGLALLARDRAYSPPLAKQVLIYPMLDDRTTVPDPAMLPFIGWSYDDNLTGWTALLGKDVGTDKVSQYAVPARAKDVSGLPPTYIDVGELDIFRDEDVEYARRLMAAGVSVELHVHPGVPHAWEFFAPGAEVSKRAIQDRIRAIMSF
jgi:acetyl esterase/lipase